MRALIGISGLLALFIILWDGFEAIIFTRRVTRKLRLTRVFYRSTWIVWSWAGRRMRPGKRRETYLSIYGQLSLFVLLTVWAVGLIAGFAMLHWSAASLQEPGRPVTFWTNLYMSGTTFVTLGLGDVTPHTRLGRLVTVAEAGTGFGFLAIVIGYVPVLYQTFSRREVNISLLDARAGSPPSALELLRRAGRQRSVEALEPFLREWERWSAELLESHISYPVLGYFRSQHDNQSWVAALTTILDASSVLLAGLDGLRPQLIWQTELTFAMARHAVVDLAQVFNAPPRAPEPDRLPPARLRELRESLSAAGISPASGSGFEKKLAELRRMYEPYVFSLAKYLILTIPAWVRPNETLDNWQTSAWERSSTGLSALPLSEMADEEHAG